jgi:hypothetical protein
MNKTFPTIEVKAIAEIKDGAMVGIGGVFATGVIEVTPEGLLSKETIWGLPLRRSSRSLNPS